MMADLDIPHRIIPSLETDQENWEWLLKNFETRTNSLATIVANSIVQNLSNRTIPQARVFHNTTQSLTSGVTTLLNYNSESFDNNSIHDTVTNNTRLTCKTAGVYHIVSTVDFAASAAGFIRTILFQLNGGTFIGNDIRPPVGGGFITRCTATCIYKLAVNDYVEVAALQDSGGALNSVNQSWTSFGMNWIGNG